MRIKLDENIPLSARTVLTQRGHDVDTVLDESLVGATDRDVVAAAAAGNRLLITLDRGLGDIRAFPPGSHAGIVVLRLADQSASSTLSALEEIAGSPELPTLSGAVVVVQRGMLRIRRP